MQAGRNIEQGSESPPTTAILRFRHSQGSLGVSRHGRIRRGGRLVVEYDPTRLSQGGSAPTASTDILCHVRFQPLGQTHRESVLEHEDPVVGATGSPPRAGGGWLRCGPTLVSRRLLRRASRGLRSRRTHWRLTDYPLPLSTSML